MSLHNGRSVQGVAVKFPELFYRAAYRLSVDLLTSELGLSLHRVAQAAYSAFCSPVAVCLQFVANKTYVLFQWIPCY
jgi:hypothetical protein